MPIDHATSGATAFIRCPVCHRPADPVLFAQHPQVDDQIQALVAAMHPGWTPERGLCPNCVLRALDMLVASGHDPYTVLRHAAVSEPDPAVTVYASPALPVPLRLHANPNFRGRGVVIAFVDSGFYPHPDLIRPRNRIRATVDATVDPPREDADFSRPLKRSWHGMMTSVVAAGNGALANGRYRGIASDAELVLIQVGQDNLRIPEADIALGLQWLLAHHRRLGVQVVNISLGGDVEAHTRRSTLDRMAGRLVAEGLVVVVAAGNAGRRGILPPASAPHVITVGGADDRNMLHVQAERYTLWRSSYGPTVAGHQKPEVLAPSIWIASPLLPGTRQHRDAGRLAYLLGLSGEELMAELDKQARSLRFRPEQLTPQFTPDELRATLARRMINRNWLSAHYQFVDGTSVAAPIVAAVAAQMLEANPTLRPARVKQILMDTAIPIPDADPLHQGAGVVNPGAAVAMALRTRGGPMTGLPLSPQVARQVVHFVYYDPQAHHVALVGDFNGWLAADSPFRRERPGVWRATLRGLPPGRYRYKFLVDGTRPLEDPDNLDREPDGYGKLNSVLTVPERA
jgi:serine protease AprX